MSDIKTIIKTLEDAVNKLSDAAAARQEPLYRSIVSMLKNLETKGDNLLNNINNLKRINDIKVKIERLILDDRYKEQIKSFVESYSEIEQLHNDYFAKFNEEFKPKDTLKIIRKTAVEATLNGLTETGIQAGVTDALRDMLFTNVGAGGSYAALTEQVRNFMLTNDTGDGALERYVKTYSTTAINQFSAEYNKAIADDLGLEWYGYDGSLLTTSRPFCVKAVDVGYLHVSQFPDLLKGDFGKYGKVPINKTTGLPSGMMAGTEKNNLIRRRGGWSCGHQMIAVSEVVVPRDLKEYIYSTNAFQTWKKTR